MKKYFIFLIILCLIGSTLAANAITMEAPIAQDKIYMWEVASKSNTSTNNVLYLLGSVRMDDSQKNAYPLDKRIEMAYSSSDKLVIEIDASKITQQQTSSSLLKYGLLENTTLDKLLPPEVFKKADSLIKQYTRNSKSLTLYSQFKPWVIEKLIVNLEFEASKEYIQSEINSYFMEKARTDKKPILELETLDYQYSTLGTQSYSLQTAMLENTINSIASYPEITESILNAWQKGDTDGITDLFSPDFNNNSVLMDSYNKKLLERNKNIAERIGSYLTAGGKYFVVVDASQLAGSSSILKLLEKMGCTVKQL